MKPFLCVFQILQCFRSYTPSICSRKGSCLIIVSLTEFAESLMQKATPFGPDFPLRLAPLKPLLVLGVLRGVGWMSSSAPSWSTVHPATERMLFPWLSDYRQCNLTWWSKTRVTGQRMRFILFLGGWNMTFINLFSNNPHILQQHWNVFQPSSAIIQ